jgi:ribosomal-protein-alanine N-acetyltransferase
MAIIFETPRLLLRQFTAHDAHLIYKLNSDPDVLKYVHEPLLKRETEAAEILNKIILPQYQLNLGRWAIHVKPGFEFIGWCGLKYIEETGIIDLGYRLLKSAWGQRYATEAAQYTIIYGLRDLKLETITGMAHADNIASIKILEKIGMKFTRNDIVDEIPVKVYTLSSPYSSPFC